MGGQTTRCCDPLKHLGVRCGGFRFQTFSGALERQIVDTRTLPHQFVNLAVGWKGKLGPPVVPLCPFFGGGFP